MRKDWLHNGIKANQSVLLLPRTSFCYSVEVYKKRTTSPLSFWYVLMQQLSMKSFWNQDISRNSRWPVGEGHVSQSMIAEAISGTFSEMATCDYGYSKETTVFQYPLKFWGNYMSFLLTLDRENLHLLHAQNLSSDFGLEIILQESGDIFRISFGQNLSSYFSMLFIFI